MLLVIWIGFGALTAIAAQARGRSFGAWLGIGLLTGVFGLIAVLVMDRVEPLPASTSASVSSFPTATEAARRRAEQEARRDAADPNFVEIYKGRRIERDGSAIKIAAARYASIADARAAVDREEA